MKRSQKITQRQAIFYQLYKSFKSADRETYIPIWKMIGEIHCSELGLWGFVSYEVSARMSEMFKMNPSLFQRTMLRGRTGAKYYGYRIAPGVQPYMIHEKDLQEFYKKIKS